MSGHPRRRALVVAILVLLSVVSGGAAIAVWRTGSGTGTATTGILIYGRLGDATTLADDIEPANTNGTWVDGTVLGARGCHRRRSEHCSGLRRRRRLRPGGAPDRRVLLDRVLVPLDAGQLDLYPDGTLAQTGTGSTRSLDETAV